MSYKHPKRCPEGVDDRKGEKSKWMGYSRHQTWEARSEPTWCLKEKKSVYQHAPPSHVTMQSVQRNSAVAFRSRRHLAVPVFDAQEFWGNHLSRSEVSRKMSQARERRCSSVDFLPTMAEETKTPSQSQEKACFTWLLQTWIQTLPCSIALLPGGPYVHCNKEIRHSSNIMPPYIQRYSKNINRG